MLVPDEVRKAVVFLAYRPAGYEAGRLKLAGTGFFVGSSTIEGTGNAFHYVVTARHVIDGIASASSDGKVYLRLNSKAGPAFIGDTDLRDWCFHPVGPGVDVALTPVAFDENVADYVAVGPDLLATDDVIAREHIGIGDEVFLTGLFINHYGRQRNMPIVRTGAIALMPEEPVDTGLGPIDAYLVEARSIGGLSGSPVFVHIAPAIRGFSGRQELVFGSRFYLLGLMHGHWETMVQRVDKMDVLPELEKMNMGIAIVVPAQRITETLSVPRLVAWREKTTQDLRAAVAAGQTARIPFTPLLD